MKITLKKQRFAMPDFFQILYKVVKVHKESVCVEFLQILRALNMTLRTIEEVFRTAPMLSWQLEKVISCCEEYFTCSRNFQDFGVVMDTLPSLFYCSL